MDYLRFIKLIPPSNIKQNTIIYNDMREKVLYYKVFNQRHSSIIETKAVSLKILILNVELRDYYL
jgi:hypothetical protein